jgi:zinc transport system ATP-binding protein
VPVTEPSRRPYGVTGAPPVLAMHGVDVGYGETPVVRDVDLVVRAGETLAVLGANGSGKTTLVRGVLGLATVMAGQLELFGVPAAHFRERYRIGYVPQRHTVGSAVPATVREVVASGRLARRGWFGRATSADRDAVADAVATVRLAERADASFSSLSGGQQRRVLIARALAAEPDVLVMDEPTAGVDVASQEALAATLGVLADRGATLVVVTHEVGALRDIVRRAVVLRDGHVSYDGPLRASMAGSGPDPGHHDGDPDGDARPAASVTGLDQPRMGRTAS